MCKILVDADACSVRDVIKDVAMKYKIPVHLYCDYSHEIEDKYCQIHKVDVGKNSADLAIVNACAPGDIVVTEDIGLAAIALAKKADVVNHTGFRYTDCNINWLLLRKSQPRGKKWSKGPKDQKWICFDHPGFAKTFQALVEANKKASAEAK